MAHVSRFDQFTFDVESDFAGSKHNAVSWIGIAVTDRVFLIPMGHPLGCVDVPVHKEKRLPPDEERKVLQNGTLSMALKQYTVEATYLPVPDQLRPDQVFAALRPIFFSDRIKINHNLKFDLMSIAKYYDDEIPPGPYVCTQILTHVLDDNLMRYSLKPLVMDWLQVPKAERAAFYPNLGKRGVDTQPFDEVAYYLAKDVWFTQMYYRYHKPLLDERLQRVFDFEMKLYRPIMEMELYGIRVDATLLAERGRVIQEQLKETTEKVWDLCGESFSLSELERKKHFLYSPKTKGGQGLKPISFTQKTKQPQVTQEVLETYAEDGNELAVLLLEASTLEKQYGTFVEGLTKELKDNRLHSSFTQTGTVTGRLSNYAPNLQQIPRGPLFRECFVADPGTLLCVADYAQMEQRVAAYLSGDPELTLIFMEERDIHSETAAALLGKPAADLTSIERQIGKTFNLGVLFGAGMAKAALVGGLTDQEAELALQNYWERFARLAVWKGEVVREARKNGRRGFVTPYVEIAPVGRLRRLPDLYAEPWKLRGKAERQAVNAKVQGLAAYIMKTAMIDLYEATKGTDWHLILTVHDELLLQAPESEAQEAGAILKATMENVTYEGEPFLGGVPLVAELGISSNWNEGH